MSSDRRRVCASIGPVGLRWPAALLVVRAHRVRELSKTLLDDLPKSGPTDPIEYYRRPLIGWLFRERINRGLRLLPERRFRCGLEVGYAAGAVQLVLATGVDELHGVDLDADQRAVAQLLARRGHASQLCRGDVTKLPYRDGMFDLVVCFSVIEHLHAYRAAVTEMARVLEPGGYLLVGMPSVNRMMELGFQAIGFRGIEHHHVTTPADACRAFTDFELEATAHLDFPLSRPLGVRLYYNWLLRRLEGDATGNGIQSP